MVPRYCPFLVYDHLSLVSTSMVLVHLFPWQPVHGLCFAHIMCTHQTDSRVLGLLLAPLHTGQCSAQS